MPRPRGEVPQSVPVPPATPRLVLVVEDEEGVRRHEVDALRELGYTVRQAASGKEALASLEAEPDVRLLLTDVVMPGMTRRELADIAVVRWPGLRVLYATGYTQNAIVHNGVVDPGVELLQKPFAIDHLARKVRRNLDGNGPAVIDNVRIPMMSPSAFRLDVAHRSDLMSPSVPG